MFHASKLPTFMFQSWQFIARTALVASVAMLGLMSRAEAHGISESSRETMTDGGIIDYIWLGAEHMVTGYDHLLFLFGVLFFLTGFRDVVRFITAFTIGHCITLMGATLLGITANAYIIDAVIALSVIYKGFENLDGFKKSFNVQAPNLLTMVFIFGLIHGFGLSTRLQELTLGHDGLVSRILAFNVGVELGQVAALTVMIGVFKAWRSSKSFERFSTIANGGLVLAGAGLFVMQVDGYLHEDHHAHETEKAAVHDDDDHSHEEKAAETAHHEPAPAKDDHGHDASEAEADKTEHKEEHSHGGAEKHSHTPKAAKASKAAAKKDHSHGGDKHSH
jgi:hydrogenase/urease accessory protein HupE